jgi:arylformamidase
MKLYRDFEFQEEIDLQYNMSLTVPDSGKWINRYPEISQKVRNEIDCALNVPYGFTVDETLDIFPAREKPAPVLLYLHGGYWYRGSSKDFSFVAGGLLKLGFTVVVADYSLCPKVSIDEITRQSRSMVVWLYNNIKKYNGNPEQIYIMGHSAGGQQVAMLLSTDWEGSYGLPENVIKGGISISGIFDLRPFPYSYLQPKLLLTMETILRQSPCFNIPESAPPLLLTFGENETAEFKRQTDDFLKLWQAKGLSGELFIQKEKHHYSIIEGLSDGDSAFCKAIMRFVKQSGLQT